MKNLAMTLAVLGLAGTAVSPVLASPTEPVTIDVPYGDLNLASPKGQAKLDRRLEKAVRKVCGADSHKGGSRIISSDTRACLAKARADVRQQVAAMTQGKQRGV